MAEPAEKPTCRTCRRPIPSFAPGGHCPHCLLRSAPVLATGPDPSPDESSWDSRFSVVEEIGEGGFGKVFLAEQHQPVRRKVALKVIKPGMGTREVIARFEAERQTLASLDHPNIAKIYDAGETADGQPAIAMEFVPGTPVNAFADRENLDLRARLDLFLQVCRGVEHAHLHGVIHRDLKPGNLLAFHDASGTPVVRIIDFGIAKATRQNADDATLLTLQPRPLGTPAYMSPEQADGRPDVDARTDVYSLGAVLYELLSGSSPLTRSGLGWSEMLDEIRDGKTLRPSTTLAEKPPPGIPWTPRDLQGDLDWIALTALAKDREERYQSVAELKRDIIAFLEGRAVEARPPSKTYRLKKLVARHRVASAALAAAVLALLLGSVASTLMAINASNARQQAEDAGDVAEQLRLQSQERFSRSDYQRACQLLDAGDFEAGDFEAGIAHLCRALRTDPANTLAADRLLTTLAYTNFFTPLTPQASHPSRVINVYFRNDREFVTVCEEGVVGLWDRTTAQQIGTWLDHGGESISESALLDGGQLLATGTLQGTVHVWDLDQQSLVFQSGNPRDGIVRTVAFLDPGHVAAGFSGGWIRTWDFHRDEQRWALETGHHVEWIDASPDATWLAVSGAPHAYLLDSKTGQRQPQNFPHDRTVRRARFSPDGTRLLTASLDATARVWNTTDGQPVAPAMRHDLALYDARWAPGGVRIATASYDSTARLWFAATGVPITPSLRHDDHVYETLIPFGGTNLFTGSRDQKLRLWDSQTGHLAAAPLTHPRSISTLAIDEQHHQLLVGGRHEHVRLLDTRPRAARPLQLRFPGTIRFAQSQGDATSVRALYHDGQQLVLERRDIVSGEALGSPLPLGPSHYIDAAKDNDRFVVKHDDHDFTIFASTAGDPLVPRITSPEKLAHVEIDRTGRFAFVGDTTGKARILKLDEPADTPYGLAFQELEPFPAGPAQDVIMLGSPLQVALRRGDTVRVYHLATGTWMPHDIQHPGNFGAWDFNPQHGLLITGGYDDTAKLWDTTTGEQRGDDLHHADANSGKPVIVKLSPDGRFAVTSSWHELGARVWNTADASLVTNPLYQNGHVESLAIDPGSRYLATTDDARTLRLWSLEDGQPAAPLQRLDAPLRSGRFTASGNGFLAVHDDRALLWPLPATTSPVPEQAIERAEKLVGRRLDDSGVLRWLPDTPPAVLRTEYSAALLAQDTVQSAWLNWILTDQQRRPASPPLPNGANIGSPAQTTASRSE